ncbi:MAG: hypothetical protein GX448_10035 [Planctomycetes bacterium]|nr:hypothetical protein [Planctomycetota bacterium]
MRLQLRAKVPLLGALVLTMFSCSSCVYVSGCEATASYRKEIPLSAPLEPGSSFAADTGDGSITIQGSPSAAGSATAGAESI